MSDDKGEGMVITHGGGMGRYATVTIKADGDAFAKGRLERISPNYFTIGERSTSA